MGRSERLRRGARSFFHQDGLVDDDENYDPVILAYWLAEIYHQSPDTFLALTVPEIMAHVANTHRLHRAVKRARKDT